MRFFDSSIDVINVEALFSNLYHNFTYRKWKHLIEKQTSCWIDSNSSKRKDCYEKEVISSVADCRVSSTQ